MGQYPKFELSEYRATVLVGCTAGGFSKSATKILRGLIAEIICDFTYRFIGVKEQILGQVHHFKLYVIQRRPARFFLYQVSEIVGRETELRRTPCHAAGLRNGQRHLAFRSFRQAGKLSDSHGNYK